MREKFEMYNLINYFMNLSKIEYFMLLDWYGDSEKIEIPFTADDYVAYTDGNLFIDRAVLKEHTIDFYLYEDEWNYYGDYGLDCPLGLSHNQTVKVLKYLSVIDHFAHLFERGFVGYGDFEE